MQIVGRGCPGGLVGLGGPGGPGDLHSLIRLVGLFLAVQDSSIGDLVSQSVTHLLILAEQS